MTDIVICSRCNGEGVERYSTDPHPLATDVTYIPCPLCKGSGRLIKEVAVSYKPYVARDADD